MGDSFTWRDGERLIRFGRGVAAEAHALLAENGFGSFVLLTTERAENALPSLRDEAHQVVRVGPGLVEELSASCSRRPGSGRSWRWAAGA